MGMMETIMMQTYYCDVSKLAHGTLGFLDADCDVSRWGRFGTDTLTTSFLDFSGLEHAQATHEQTEQPTTQLKSVSFVDANILLLENG